MKYAPVSDMNAPTSGAMASAGETQRSSARLAKPAGSSGGGEYARRERGEAELLFLAVRELSP